MLWHQILDKAKEIKKPIVFITNEVKDDWWRVHDGRVIGPRPELVHEMLSTSKVPFYMYSSDKFMEYAKTNLSRQVPKKAIDEVRKIREESKKQADFALIFDDLNKQKNDIYKYNNELQILRNENEILVQKEASLRNQINSIENTDTSKVSSDKFSTTYFNIYDLVNQKTR